MAVRNRSAESPEIDLEATAELPAIDFSQTAPSIEEANAATDVFPSPPLVPAGVVDLADSLREVENRLQRKLERVSSLQTELAEARASEQELRAQLLREQTESRAQLAREQTEARTQLSREQTEARTRESALGEQIAATAKLLETVRADLASRETELAAARSDIESLRTQLSAARAELERSAVEQRHNTHDLQELRRRSERQLEALRNVQGVRAISDALIAERDEALQAVGGEHARELGEALARHSVTQAELSAARQELALRIGTLQDSLQKSERAQQAQVEALRIAGEHSGLLTTQITERDASIAAQLTELISLRAQEEKARAGAAAFDDQLQQIARLTADLAATKSKSSLFESDLRLAEERIARLESEAHANSALLGNLQQNIQRLGREDTGSRPSLKVVNGEIPVRVLLRFENGVELTHQLGRRTSIGRTPDNDIPIDTTWISRHHAVLLANAESCVIEDLNSTNGVLVNGRRINRQMLHDGDMVTLGKTEFRYQQRS
jgi:predicted  nucleic acid-binding Zn-ribbon protein